MQLSWRLLQRWQTAGIWSVSELKQLRCVQGMCKAVELKVQLLQVSQEAGSRCMDMPSAEHAGELYHELNQCYLFFYSTDWVYHQLSEWFSGSDAL
ncbi:hypothetical protein F2P79_000845 [Pimephales promelas]|nr:hypothetical protein F2P79_000845 [Pimephales promelas]